jgi:hypothetical protein
VKGPYLELARRIEGECAELGQAVKRIDRAWVSHAAAPGEDAYLDSVALNLHGFYSGVERVLTLVIEQLDGVMPGGDDWHQRLLEMAAAEVPGLRPAILGTRTAAQLSEYRRFRHLVRNIYASHLLPERMEGLVVVLPSLWQAIRAELLAFAEFLKALSAQM